MTGVDLTRIDGVDGFTALKVISEVGTDMTKWPSAKHFASWLGQSPDNRITGGRVMSSKTKPSASRAAAALRLGGQRAAPFRQRPGRLPAPEERAGRSAQGHHSHSPQVGQAHPFHAAVRPEYADAGAEYYERQYQQRALLAAKRRAAKLGYQLVPMSDAPEHPTYAPPGAPIAAWRL